MWLPVKDVMENPCRYPGNRPREGRGAVKARIPFNPMVEACMNLSPTLGNRQPLQMLSGSESRQVFRGIYDNILLTSSGARQKSLLICAANRGEGASTVALGIAMAAAEVRDQPVLLIDGNLSHPQVCEAFGMTELHGLGDLLAGSIDVKSAVRSTPIQNLQVMGAGIAPSSQISMLESPAFKNLLDRLDAAYALIIIDGPPVNGFPESVLFAVQVDRVLLVVKSGITRVQVVSTALARLAARGCDQVDLVLNRRTFPIPPWLYRRL
jgi:capsular exopolysaccharide synthesis family protein